MEINPKPTLTTLGGKGYQLTKLMQHFNIPPFFVISFENFDEISKIQNQKDILQQCHDENLDVVAVRSSASVEDSNQASFAGMFETVLNVPSLELISAIQKVIESVRSMRVSHYCETHEIEKNNIQMNVIVQKMVRSRVSGVCFTRTKQTDQLVIEACYGLGEALVSGKITPDTYNIDRHNFALINEVIGYQKVELRLKEGGYSPTGYLDVPFHKRNARKLTMNEIIEIAKDSIIIEEYLDFVAADIEWAFEKNILYILQARPYTVF